MTAETRAMEFKGSPRQAEEIIAWAATHGGLIRYHSDPSECLTIHEPTSIETARVGDWVVHDPSGGFCVAREARR